MTNNRRRGITLIEVLVVVAICLVIAGLGVMFIARHRETALRAQCHNNFRSLGLAFQAYHTKSSAGEHLRALPPARIAEGYATWVVFLAPHLTSDSPLHTWDFSEPYWGQNDAARQARLIMYFCPSRTRADTLSRAGDIDRAKKHYPGSVGDYASVAGDGSDAANAPLIDADELETNDGRIVKWHSRTTLADSVSPSFVIGGIACAYTERTRRGMLERGQSYTLLLGEKHVAAAHFGDAEFGDGSLYNGANPASYSRVAGPGFPLAPSIDAPFNNNFGSWHKGVCHFLFADGSVQPMALHTSAQVLGQLSRRGH